MKDMLGEVLARIGQEMATIAETSAALEAIIQHTMASSQSPLDLETFHSLQGMDLMTQKIGDLGRFLAHISSAYCDVPIEMSEALAVLHLQDVANSISGEGSGQPPETGTIEIFL